MSTSTSRSRLKPMRHPPCKAPGIAPGASAATRWWGLLILLLGLSWAGAAEYHVAPGGHDANPGSESRPFASLERARAAVQEARAATAGETVTVWLHGGDYLRTNALELGPADSGTPNAPTVWRAWKQDRARLLGGRALGPFQPVTDSAVRARFDETARPHIRQFDLRAMGITGFGEMKSRGFDRPTAVAHWELFFDHRPMTLARWPNEGEFIKIAGYPAGETDAHGGQLGALTNGFFYSGDRPRRWREVGDLWAHGYWAYDWANSYERIASLDRERRLVRTAPPYGHYGFRKDQRFYFLNILEELDAPGEWFLERRTGRIYFWPPPTPNPAPEILLSLLDQPLLKLNAVSNVVFRGLTFEATRAHGIEINGGANIRMVSCLLRNIGNSAVVVSGGYGHGVEACDIWDTGDGGVDLNGGDRQTLVPGGHYVENCHFQRQGRWSKCYVPPIHLTGVGLRASHNLIHDQPHCAILFWGNDHLMEFNEIHHIALETGDVGAIYTGRDYTFRGNRIRHNFIHHTGGVGMGSMGVYMDDCVSGTEVFGNVFHQVHWAMFIGGGRDHRVENNLFVDCDPAVRVDGRGLDPTPVWRNMVNDTMRRRLHEVPLDLYRTRYPALKSLDAYYGPPGGPAITGGAFHGVPPEGNRLAQNVCVGKWLDVGWHATTALLELTNNLTNAAGSLATPLQDSASLRDFVLQPDSPAFAHGFRRIPVEAIGLRDDAARRAVEAQHQR
ncbi:MAG TPA: right-handed parallel beta-helix repeat-containing protein [Verrucomicrobiota bacterium]|nr:right-handed parallel beta-helix repeat-containing protein [Verrucomicrobiota bacterium]HNT15731.1 right-handed parallel beta-helix repeat-containing protein [Verrucomicrobiota bacterium]